MSDAWREVLYIPLGVIPALFFGSRWIVQWIQSERKGSSVSGPAFWGLSLCGNILLLLHYLIQVQYHFALMQAINATISWRNLNILRSVSPYSTRQVLWIALGVVTFVTLLFAVQGHWVIGEWAWIRTPITPFSSQSHTYAFSWHLLGTAGMLLFASRFWWQWWLAERHMRSDFDTMFWYLSMIGSLLTVAYALQIGDVVSLLHNGLAVIPSLRNLMLIRRSARIVG